MMTEIDIKEEISRHRALMEYENKANNPIRAKLHRKVAETYEAVLLNDTIRIVSIDL